MSADAFHSYAPSCPLCGQGNALSIGRLQGRLVCPYCNSNLVVSTDGQFVRDPFASRKFVSKPLLSIQQLRRRSSPIARIFRDVRPSMQVLLGTILLLTVAGTLWTKVSGGTMNQLLQPLSLQTTK